MFVSAAFCFHGKPFDLKAAVISDLESPEDNPRGYEAGAAGTAVCGLLLLPVARLFYRRLRSKPALAGVALLGSGLACMIAIGLLAPFTRGYTPAHIQLAYFAFIGIIAGLVVLLALAGRRGMALFNSAILLFLLYLYFATVDFDNSHLLTSLAFCEWMLCANCAVSLWILERGLITAAASRNPQTKYSR